MQRKLQGLTGIVGAGAMLLLIAAGCSGGSSSSGSPTSPSAPSPAPAGSAVTIEIVGMKGNQSFSPATVNVSAGQQIVFHNADSTAHRIQQNSGAWDTGNLDPGASSAPITISGTSEQPFHCTYHPTMVGSINGSSTDTGGNPCQGVYCG